MPRKTSAHNAPLARIARTLEEFDTFGAFYGGRPRAYGTGWLDELGAAAFDRDRAHGADYAIYSYATPIAWHVPAHSETLSDGTSIDVPARWVVTRQRFSATTSSHHQSRLWKLGYETGALIEHLPTFPQLTGAQHEAVQAIQGAEQRLADGFSVASQRLAIRRPTLDALIRAGVATLTTAGQPRLTTFGRAAYTRPLGQYRGLDSRLVALWLDERAAGVAAGKLVA